MTELEVAAEMYRRAELEFQAADSAESLLHDQVTKGWDAIEAAHPEFKELRQRFGAANQHRQETLTALCIAKDALLAIAKGVW